MSERRSFLILLAVLVGQLILLAVQVGQGRPAGGIESWLLRAVGPLGRLVDGAGDQMAGVAAGLASLARVQKENAALRREVEQLRRRLLAVEGLRGEYERLARAVGYAQVERPPLLVADVLLLDRGSPLESLILFAGPGRSLVDQAVVTAAGLVGRIIRVAGPYAKAQLITDRTSTVGAMIDRTRRQGLIRGAAGGDLSLDFVPVKEDVQAGDAVVTSGIDGIFPRGIPIGTVTAVGPGEELFHGIRVRPAVDFGTLDQVYVVGRDPVPPALRPEPAGVFEAPPQAPAAAPEDPDAAPGPGGEPPVRPVAGPPAEDGD